MSLSKSVPALQASGFTLRPLAIAAMLLPLLPLLPNTAMAQQADGVAEKLDPILVSAQRGNDTNTVVRANRIAVEQALGLGDLFKQTPEVSVGGGGLQVAQKLYVRGLAERMLSITIDGASQNESPYHHSGQVMIDPNLLKRVEIEAGSGAATAGPGALAGALRFTTKSASDLLRKDERIGAWLQADGQSANRGHKLAATVFGRMSEQFSVLGSVSQLHSQDYKAGDGNRIANTAQGSSSQFVKFDIAPAKGHKLQLGIERNRDEGWRNQRSNLQLAGFNLAQEQRMERESNTLNYDFAPGGKLLNLHLTAYQNQNTVHLAQNTAKAERIGTRTQGLNLLNVARVAEHKISAGMNYRHDTGFSSNNQAALPDEKASVIGLFVQDDWALADQWLLVTGARFDRYRYTDMANQQFNSSGFSPSASLSYLPNEHFTLRLNYASALRGVGVLEPYLKAFQANDVALNPEKASTLDLNAQWQNGPWRATASVYRQTINNYLGYDDARQNLGQVRVNGYSASAAYQAGPWSASLGVSHAKPSLNGAPLSSGDAFLLGNAAGRTWVAQVDYAMPAQHLLLGASARLTEQLDYVPTGAQTKAGYTVMDVYAQWLPTGKEDVRVNLGVKNLFNKFYYDQSSFGYHPRWKGIAALPESGRDVRVSVAWRF